MTWGWYRLRGGRNKDRPDNNDLKRAKDFAQELKDVNAKMPLIAR
jgi:hypothetical protein